MTAEIGETPSNSTTVAIILSFIVFYCCILCSPICITACKNKSEPAECVETMTEVVAKPRDHNPEVVIGYPSAPPPQPNQYQANYPVQTFAPGQAANPVLIPVVLQTVQQSTTTTIAA